MLTDLFRWIQALTGTVQGMHEACYATKEMLCGNAGCTLQGHIAATRVCLGAGPSRVKPWLGAELRITLC